MILWLLVRQLTFEGRLSGYLQADVNDFRLASWSNRCVGSWRGPGRDGSRKLRMYVMATYVWAILIYFFYFKNNYFYIELFMIIVSLCYYITSKILLQTSISSKIVLQTYGLALLDAYMCIFFYIDNMHSN
jgi:hypothetical protein